MRVFAAFIALGVVASGYGQEGRVMTWSAWVNRPEWNRSLGVTASRQGCSNSPEVCVQSSCKTARELHFEIFLAIPLNSHALDNASEYSRLSLTCPQLIEVGFDDFLDQYRAIGRSLPNPSKLLREFIVRLKSANPKLRFGGTIYEDQLSIPGPLDSELPSAIRKRFDYVHLFVHYREDGPSYANYVSEAKRLFPHARIIAGAYAYDRRAYLPCSPSGHPCTPAEELDLYRETMEIQIRLLKDRVTDGIEFYPGYFGVEEQWGGWNNPKACALQDVTLCIANTKSMRQATVDALKRESGQRTR